MAEKIKFGKFVELAYEVLVVDADGEAQVFKFDKKRPDSFVYGLEDGMLDGFVKGISGLEPGDKFEFTLPPAEAFGDKDPQLVHELDREIFVVDGKFDDEKVYEGAYVPMMTAEGHRLDGLVEKVTADKVVMDFNHQLAGETVRYRGEVLTVRDATPEEVNPPHQCGCGCGHHHEHGEHHHEHDGHCGCEHHHEHDGHCGCEHHHEHGEHCGCDCKD